MGMPHYERAAISKSCAEMSGLDSRARSSNDLDQSNIDEASVNTIIATVIAMANPFTYKGLAKTNKSVLLHQLENAVIDLEPPVILENSAMMVDAIALVHDIPTTFGDPAKKILDILLSIAKQHNCSRVDCVADQYPDHIMQELSKEQVQDEEVEESEESESGEESEHDSEYDYYVLAEIGLSIDYGKEQRDILFCFWLQKTKAPKICAGPGGWQNCQALENKNNSIPYLHRFPCNTERKAKWLHSMRILDWSPSANSKICSDHFVESNFDRTGKIVRLKKIAVPTRFKQFPKHLKKVIKERKEPATRTLQSVDLPLSNLHALDDHQYQIVLSPKKLKQDSAKHIRKLQNKLKLSQKRSRRLNFKVNSLIKIVKCLQEKQLISTGCEEMLKQNFVGVPLEIMKRLTSGRKSGKGCKYSPELRSFALTLQFYSAKAYEFVRTSFNLALPHQSEIRHWYSKIPAEPGFTEPAFQALSAKVDEAAKKGRQIVCSLMLDEMAIKKHVSWDGIRFRGYVDIGNGAEDDDSAPVAKDALVFMVVSINGSWKVPCAYFFVDGLSGADRANLVKICIEKLHDAGVSVVSLTCDGPSCHFTMMNELGACLKPNNLKAFFPHPLEPNKKIHVLLDVCHMLKLVRNTLGQGGILMDKDGNKIYWNYIVELQKLQDKEGLRLGNKLKAAHIKWHQQKMKVSLAAQVFSASVADAIEYCTNVLKLKQFEGSAATVKFIRLFDHLFDILNSRNPCAKGYKAALRVNNKVVWGPFLDEAFQYVLHLKDPTGQAMHTTRRKTGFIGFLAAIESTKGIFYDLVEQDQAPLKFMLTYKLSQDHIELFFGAVRAAGGFNNNPTAQQFTAAYKRLLLRSSIGGGKGNCQQQDQTNILHILDDTYNINDQDVGISNVALIGKYDLADRRPMQSDHDYSDSPSITNLSEFKEAAITYIAGYVARKVKQITLCSRCCEALGSQKHATDSSFLKLKDRGGLFKPTQSVIEICKVTEQRFQRMLASTNGKLPQAVKMYVSHTLRCTDDDAEQEGLTASHFALRCRICPELF
ncbi:DNA transposase THAP9 [Nymphon striatum]|nr:DNA transposase THAP9 [Nymphon striatum]